MLREPMDSKATRWCGWSGGSEGRVVLVRPEGRCVGRVHPVVWEGSGLILRAREAAGSHRLSPCGHPSVWAGG